MKLQSVHQLLQESKTKQGVRRSNRGTCLPPPQVAIGTPSDPVPGPGLLGSEPVPPDRPGLQLITGSVTPTPGHIPHLPTPATARGSSLRAGNPLMQKTGRTDSKDSE
ncbi:hypothetical protein J1605_010220 [Eschrichtius robustus]|uniref:Uncharacterized protein n=1 Tax=Eschrichtius robustus TaxID=9764 RepID=A0AB34GTX2_ESCRO|nr:hypothetical protein J1605_010220 [Eschrichtius robustus]